MEKDEAIILKIYDSLAAGFTPPSAATGPVPRARWTLHTSFDNPLESIDDGTAPGPRESCEVRCLVLWAPEELPQQAEPLQSTG